MSAIPRDFNNPGGNLLKQAFITWLGLHYERRTPADTLPEDLCELATCRDSMPDCLCHALLLPDAATYASAVAAVLAEQQFIACVLANGVGYDWVSTFQAVRKRHGYVPECVLAALHFKPGSHVTFCAAANGTDFRDLTWINLSAADIERLNLTNPGVDHANPNGGDALAGQRVAYP
jgi:hypothetical protein